MKSESELKKVEDMIFKFEKVEDSIYGVLMAVEHGSNFGNKVYKIKTEDGNIYTVFSTTVLESKMSTVKIGDTVKIVYVGDKENKKSGQNPIKVFEVYA